MLMDLHMHSKYSDGKNTPEEMIEAAISLQYDAVAITDHVWKTSLWVPQYAAHLDRLKKKYADIIRVYSGIEAKVLSLEGDIDADPSFDSLVDLVLGSIHRIPKPDGYFSRAEAGNVTKRWIIKNWLTSFYRMLENPRVDIIAHPLAELKGFGVTSKDLPILEIVDQIVRSKKIMEFNVRYNTFKDPVIQFAVERGVPFLISSDSHTVQDLTANSKMVKEMAGKGFQIVDIDYYLLQKKG